MQIGLIFLSLHSIFRTLKPSSRLKKKTILAHYPRKALINIIKIKINIQIKDIKYIEIGSKFSAFLFNHLHCL